jgi:G3E family GTPase
MSQKPQQKWTVGDAVVIDDFSEAHGDRGCIHAIQENGIILVELEQGCIWPVEYYELKRDEEVEG